MKTSIHSLAKIWDEAPHCAFTSLTRFHDQWFCTFREGREHGSPDGKIRVITSSDGLQWLSAALLESPDANLPDLRDPKIGATPDKRLMLMGAATSRNENFQRGNYVWFSDDGLTWSAPDAMGGGGDWIWSFTWSGREFFGAGYDGTGGVKLHRGTNALQLEEPTTLHRDAQCPNEAVLLMEDENGLAIIRREFAPGQTKAPPCNCGTALLASSQAPFEHWTTHDLNIYVGGPNMLRLRNGKIIVAGRKIVSDQHSMALWELNEEQASLQELRTLPSGGDCSYPGLFWHDEKLWVSYYSSHEGKSSIYLAGIVIH